MQHFNLQHDFTHRHGRFLPEIQFMYQICPRRLILGYFNELVSCLNCLQIIFSSLITGCKIGFSKYIFVNGYEPFSRFCS